MTVIEAIRRKVLPRPGDKEEIKRLLAEMTKDAEKLRYHASVLDALVEVQAEVTMEKLT